MYIILLLLMNFFYAGTPVFMKLASAEMTPFQIVFLRHTLAMLAFLPFVLKSHHRKIKRPDFLYIMLGAFLAFTFASIFQIIGLKFSQATDGSFILAMEPVITIALAFFFLRECFDAKMGAGLALAFMGFVILSSGALHSSFSANGRWMGNLIFLLAVTGESSFPILLKPLLDRYPPTIIAFYCLLCSSLYMLPFQREALWQSLPQMSWTTWGAVLYLGLGCSFLACFLWLTCLKHFTVSMVAVSWFMQPVLGCLYSLFILREPMTSSVWVGGCLIIAALGLMTKRPERAPSKQPAQGPSEWAPLTLLRIQHPLWTPKPLTYYGKTEFLMQLERAKRHRALTRQTHFNRHKPQRHPQHLYH